jgi:hypothetical protein
MRLQFTRVSSAEEQHGEKKVETTYGPKGKRLKPAGKGTSGVGITGTQLVQ